MINDVNINAAQAQLGCNALTSYIRQLMFATKSTYEKYGN